MKYCIYDIETFENDRLGQYLTNKEITPDARLTDPKKIEADIVKKKAAIAEKAGLSPITGRVTCMGLSYGGEFKFFIEKDEARLLTDINEFIAGIEVSDFVGKNNWDFDLPFLRVRHLAHGIPIPEWLRPSTRHTDISRYFGRNMGQRGPSLADLEWVMNITREGEKDGKQALQWWKDGEWELLEQYNMQDVRSTEAIFLAMEGV